MSRLRFEFADLDALQTEFDTNLKNGGTFLAGASGEERSACEVELVHPLSGETMLLEAEIVWVKAEPPGNGVGVQFVKHGPDLLKLIEDFIQRGIRTSSEGDDSGGDDQNIQARLRGLSVTEALQVAKDGSLSERTVLERIYGKTVWEALLRNPRITDPEVARIARMGALPKPLIEMIASNPSWTRSSQVRRALLTNPRLTGSLIARVLKSCPKQELKLMPQQTAYPAPIRAAAKKLLGL